MKKQSSGEEDVPPFLRMQSSHQWTWIVLLLLVIVGSAWKASTYIGQTPMVIPTPMASAQATPWQPLPEPRVQGQIKGVVTSVDVSKRRIVIEAKEDNRIGTGRKVTGIAKDDTLFFLSVKSADYGNVLLFKRSSIKEIKKGQTVIFSAKGGENAVTKDEFELLSVIRQEIK